MTNVHETFVSHPLMYEGPETEVCRNIDDAVGWTDTELRIEGTLVTDTSPFGAVFGCWCWEDVRVFMYDFDGKNPVECTGLFTEDQLRRFEEELGDG